MLLFSYGSNMCSSRLKARISSIRVIGIGKLYKHVLGFHKMSVDGSGKADVLHTGINSHFVWGVVAEIDPSEKKILDTYEDYGKGYLDKVVDIEMEAGELIGVLTYYAIKIDSELKPYSWYLDFVLAGAREHGLPEDYIQRLEQIESVQDPEMDRAVVNREILYGSS